MTGASYARAVRAVRGLPQATRRTTHTHRPAGPANTTTAAGDGDHHAWCFDHRTASAWPTGYSRCSEHAIRLLAATGGPRPGAGYAAFGSPRRVREPRKTGRPINDRVRLSPRQDYWPSATYSRATDRSAPINGRGSQPRRRRQQKKKLSDSDRLAPAAMPVKWASGLTNNRYRKSARLQLYRQLDY